MAGKEQAQSLTRRLRKMFGASEGLSGREAAHQDLGREAADRIEELEAEVRRLRRRAAKGRATVEKR